MRMSVFSAAVAALSFLGGGLAITAPANAVEFCLRQGILKGSNPWIRPWRTGSCKDTDEPDCIRLEKLYLVKRWNGYICERAEAQPADDWCVRLHGVRYVAKPCAPGKLCFG